MKLSLTPNPFDSQEDEDLADFKEEMMGWKEVVWPPVWKAEALGDLLRTNFELMRAGRDRKEHVQNLMKLVDDCEVQSQSQALWMR